MTASPLEWLFFGGPVGLMVGVPILIFIVVFIFSLLKAGFDALTGKGGK